jgi:hypothetical protein
MRTWLNSRRSSSYLVTRQSESLLMIKKKPTTRYRKYQNHILGGWHGSYICFTGMERHNPSTFVCIHRTNRKDLAADCIELDTQTRPNCRNRNNSYAGQPCYQTLDSLSQVFLSGSVVAEEMQICQSKWGKHIYLNRSGL